MPSSHRAASRRRAQQLLAVLAAVALASVALVQLAPATPARAATQASATSTSLRCDQNTLYAVNDTNELMAIDVDVADGATATTSEVADLGSANNGLAIALNGTAAYAAANGGASLSSYDPASGTTTPITGFGKSSLQAIRGAVDPTTGIYYYAGGSATATLSAYDPKTGTSLGQVGQISGLNEQNGDMAFSRGGLLFVVSGDEILRVNAEHVPSTNDDPTQTLTTSLVTKLPAGTNSPGIAFASDGYLYVSDSATVKLLKFDPETGEQVATLGLENDYTPSDLASCNYANTLSAQSGADELWKSTDAFPLTVTDDDSTLAGGADRSQTGGGILTLPGRDYTVTQTGADPTIYTTSYSCDDVNSTSDDPITGTGSTAHITDFPTTSTADGVDIVCTFTNTLTATHISTVADSGTTAVNAALAVTAPGLLGNDSGTGKAVAGNTQPKHGTVAVSADGSYTYTPTACAPGSCFTGTDSFTYTAQDSSGQVSGSTTVTIAVTPQPKDDVATTYANQKLTVAADHGILGNDLGTSLQFASADTDDTIGAVAVNRDGSYAYTPKPDYSGPDGFGYTLGGQSSSTAAGRVTITVLPTAGDNSISTTAGVTTTVSSATLRGNDAGSSLQITGYTTGANGTVSGTAPHSAALLRAAAATATYDSLSYTPDAGFSGTDEFTYTVADASGQTVTATVHVTVDDVATPDLGSTDAGATLDVPAADGVLGNDVGTGLTASLKTGPAHGTLQLDADGAYRYTPDAGFSGSDAFTYTATDDAGDTSTATVTISVIPLVADDTVATTAGTTGTLDAPGVLQNDTGLALTPIVVEAPAHGILVISPDGTLDYTPDAGYSGPDTATYGVIDGADNSSATATISITVAIAAPDGTGTSISGTTLQRTATGGLLDDGQGTGLTVALGTAPRHGTLKLSPDGAYAYTPDADYTGTDEFTYIVTDASGQTTTATMRFTVLAHAVAIDDTDEGQPGEPITVDPLTNDSPTGTAHFARASLRVLDATSRATDHLTVDGEGVWTVDDGAVTFTPEKSFGGTATITYRVTDSEQQTVTAQITVRYPDPAPTVLPTTGTRVPVGWVLGGGLAMALGAALILLRRRAARR